MTQALKQPEKYVLAQGADADFRLKIVQGVHGGDSEKFMHFAGIRPGMRVADIGCGVGRFSLVISQLVSPTGSVTGVDVAPQQVEQAARNAQEAGVENTCFVSDSAYSLGLESDGFDFVASRFMLMHLQDPLAAIAEMKRILKPGGILAIEDGDFTSPFSWPPSSAFDRCFELYRALGETHGEHFEIGKSLYTLVRQAGFEDAQAQLVQPVFTRGDEKRLPEWTLEESADLLIDLKLSTRGEISRLLVELARLAENETVAFGMARMMQVWATKPT